ncbi:MAG: PilZ domain-containing protein [Legionella sp.]|nr:PilZ domain-containing protein [Legionella sp.]
MTDTVQINCSFPDKNALHTAYMPFLQGGGLFVRSNQLLPLGTLVILFINLLNEPKPYKIEAKVAWITHEGTQGNKPAGMGLQFIGENCRRFSNKIETCLAGMLKSTQTTDTM